MACRSVDHGAPGLRLCGVAREEIVETRVVEGVVGRESRDPRQATEVDGETTPGRGIAVRPVTGRDRGGQPSGWGHSPVLSQSVAQGVKN
jgi:hypothetical protein